MPVPPSYDIWSASTAAGLPPGDGTMSKKPSGSSVAWAGSAVSSTRPNPARTRAIARRVRDPLLLPRGKIVMLARPVV